MRGGLAVESTCWVWSPAPTRWPQLSDTVVPAGRSFAFWPLGTRHECWCTDIHTHRGKTAIDINKQKILVNEHIEKYSPFHCLVEVQSRVSGQQFQEVGFHSFQLKNSFFPLLIAVGEYKDCLPFLMFSFLFRWERGAWKVLVFGNLAVTHLVGSFVSSSKPLTLHADSYSVLWHKIWVKEWSVREEEEVPFNSCPTFTSRFALLEHCCPFPQRLMF